MRGPDHASERKRYAGKGFRDEEAVPASEIPGPVGEDIEGDDGGPGCMRQLNHARLHGSGRSLRAVDDVAGQPGPGQMLDHFSQCLFPAARRRSPYGAPAAPFRHAGDDFTIGAVADHQRGLEISVPLEMADSGKELLVPGA